MNPPNTKNRAQFLIRFGYAGHLFHGVQPQRNVPTAGGALKALLTRAAGEEPKALQFSARTDKGVHAEQNIATCWFRLPFDHERFLQALGQTKIEGLHNVVAELVPFHLHARGSSRGKVYRYVIEDGMNPDELESVTEWRVVPRLDVERMREASLHFVGEHNFESFCKDKGTAKNPVKVISSIGFECEEIHQGRRITIEIAGNAFLRQMIRIMVGTLVEVGVGFRQPGDMPGILEARARRCAGISAPAQGLTLVRVGFAWPA